MPIDGRTHYQRLGVDPTASADEIRRAYRAMAKVAHPDAGGDADAFRLLTDAYDTLSNPTTRRDYDDRLQVERFVQGSSSGGFAGSDGAPPAGDPASRSWRASGSGAGGWSGTDGEFTGDVEFPSYLRDVADAPWSESAQQTAARAADEQAAEARTRAMSRPADVVWWSPEPAIVAPSFAGQLVIAPTAGAIVALDAFFGREIWRAEVVAPAVGPTIHVGETIVAWTTDGLLHGLELGRGVTRWEQPIGTPGAGQLVLVNGLVVAATDTHVLAIDPVTGKTRWEGSLVAPPTVPVVAVGTNVVVGTAKGIDAFDSRKGKVRWRAPSRTPVDLPLCPLGESVWVSAGGHKLHRLDITNGAGVGTWEVGSPIAGLTADGAVAYATVVGPAQLVAVDPSGWVRWATGLDQTSPEPALIAGTAYVAEPGGRILAVDTVDGSILGGVTVPFEPFGAPLGFVDRLVLQERGGHVWCIDLPSWQNES